MLDFYRHFQAALPAILKLLTLLLVLILRQFFHVCHSILFFFRNIFMHGFGVLYLHFSFLRNVYQASLMIVFSSNHFL